jgi:hypothetical protein
MDMELVVSILTGLSVAIPMVVALVVYVKKSIQEKNWTALLALVTDLMAQAEKNFQDGASRKSWVMSMVKSSMNTLNYPVDLAVVSKLIDDLCYLSKQVNVTVKSEA